MLQALRSFMLWFIASCPLRKKKEKKKGANKPGHENELRKIKT
jgi:hypothetical protein